MYNEYIYEIMLMYFYFSVIFILIYYIVKSLEEFVVL